MSTLHRLLHWLDAHVPYVSLIYGDVVTRPFGRVYLVGFRCNVCGRVEGISELAANGPLGAKLIATPRPDLDGENGREWTSLRDSGLERDAKGNLVGLVGTLATIGRQAAPPTDGRR